MRGAFQQARNRHIAAALHCVGLFLMRSLLVLRVGLLHVSVLRVIVL